MAADRRQPPDERAEAEANLAEADRELARCRVLLSPSTIAKRLGVHVETVRGWIRDDKIEYVRLPNGYYKVSGATLDHLLSAK
jgi:excisionase family DNA binding protein